MRFCVFGIALLCLQTFVLGQFGGRPPFFRPGRIEVLGSSPFGPPMFRPPPFFGSGDFTPSFGGGEFGGPFPGFGGPGPFGGPFRGGPPITTGGPGGPGRPGFPTGPGFETAGPGGIGGTFGGPGPMSGGRGPGGPPGPTRPGGPTGPMGPTGSSGFFTDPTTDRTVQVVPSDTASAVRTARTGGFGGMGGFGDGSSRFGGGPGGPGGDGRFPTFSGTATGGFTPRGDIFGGSGFDPRMSGSDPRFSGDSRSATGMDGRGMDFGRTGSFTGRTGDFGRPADFGGRSADFGRTGDFGSRPSEFGRGGDVGRSSMDRTGISDSMGRGQGVIRIRIPVDGQAVITRDGVTEPLPAGTSLQDLGITGDFGGRGTIDTTVSGSSMMTPSQGMGGPPRDSGMTFTSTVSQTDNTGVVGGNTFVTTSTTETGAPSISGAPGGPDLVVMNMEDLRDPRNLDAIYKALAEISSGGTVSGSTQSGTPVMT